MSKNLKFSFLICFIISAITIAWHTLSEFFYGTGLSYVAILVGVALFLFIILLDKYAFNRTRDLFTMCCVLAILESFVFFPCEFGACSDPDVAIVFFNLQNVFTVIGLLFFVYVVFRLITEAKNIRISFVETLLGNEKVVKVKKEKKSKELSNGSLEEKPVNTESEETAETQQNEESSEE